jgi:hypothetical protein
MNPRTHFSNSAPVGAQTSGRENHVLDTRHMDPLSPIIMNLSVKR